MEKTLNEKELLIKELKELPDAIKAIEKNIVLDAYKKKDSEDVVKSLITRVKREILEDKEKEAFKGKLTNAELRDVELHKRLSEIPAYGQHKEFIEESEHTYELVKIELSYQKRRYQNCLVLLRLLGGEE